MSAVLIVGASRGIGLEFIKELVNRKNPIVFAAVRNPFSLQIHFPSLPDNLHIVQCDVTSDESVSAATDTYCLQNIRKGRCTY